MDKLIVSINRQNKTADEDDATDEEALSNKWSRIKWFVFQVAFDWPPFLIWHLVCLAATFNFASVGCGGLVFGFGGVSSVHHVCDYMSTMLLA